MNHDLEMRRVIGGLGEKRPRLLLHSCCGPCSVPAFERLSEYFELTVFYYNPNILSFNEFEKRLFELRRLMASEPFCENLIVPTYNHTEFIDAVRGLENMPEGGERCKACFKLRFERTAFEALKGDFDFFSSTITTGPRKNAETVNAVGEMASLAADAQWLPADFKKRGGYQESVRRSKELGMYRQDFCGCEFSLKKKQ